MDKDSTVLQHELAVLRPKKGDVVVLYLDPYTICDAEMIAKFMASIRHDGITAGIILTTDPFGGTDMTTMSREDVEHELNSWLRPFGYRAVANEV